MSPLQATTQPDCCLPPWRAPWSLCLVDMGTNIPERVAGSECWGMGWVGWVNWLVENSTHPPRMGTLCSKGGYLCWWRSPPHVRIMGYLCHVGYFQDLPCGQGEPGKRTREWVGVWDPACQPGCWEGNAGPSPAVCPPSLWATYLTIHELCSSASSWVMASCSTGSTRAATWLPRRGGDAQLNPPGPELCSLNFLEATGMLGS